MVKKIHLATKALLTEEGVEFLSTKRIAKRAGISPGVLYHYYPNKQAIINAIYQEWLDNFNAQGSEIYQQRDQYPNYQEWLKAVFLASYQHIPELSPTEIKMENELRKAVRVYPELARLEQIQGEAVSRHLAKVARYYGSTWSEQELNRLCLHLYKLIVSFEAVYGDNPENLEEAMQWHIKAITALWDICMPKRAPE